MKKALLIIDIQNDYFDMGKMPITGAMEAGQNARLILDKFRADHLPVIHIQHISTRPNATFFLPETAGADIHEIVKPMEGEKVIIKHFPNSFRETELLEHLRGMNITDLTICGMMTHMCVDATVRAAKDYGFNITLISDACAAKDLQSKGDFVKASLVQNSFTYALEYFYAQVITARAYITMNNEQ